ncbi:MAG TPA: Ivy family c-type lysozyme inhibitor [Vineibacter sp.]|nr:Ivy family c-type lysozyme inhibitor [Vineibacter sp.]
MRRLFVVAMGLSLFMGSAQAAEPYLYELIKQPAYRTSLSALLRPLGERDGYLVEVLKEKGNYLAFPSRQVTVDGRPYRLVTACEPRMDCKESGSAFLFTPAGDRAWALVYRTGMPETYLGAPSEGQKLVLDDALR